MTLSELLPVVTSLSQGEKKQLLEILAEQLETSELKLLGNDSFELVSPWNEHEAADVLQRFIDESTKVS